MEEYTPLTKQTYGVSNSYNKATKNLPKSEPHLPELIGNSPYCLSYNSCDISLENLWLDQLIIL